MSLNLGKNDKKAAKNGIGNSITLVSILGVLFLIFGLIFNEQLLHIFGVTEKSYQFSKDYMMIIIIGLPFFMIGNAINSMIRADGNPKEAMKVMLVGAILNMILDPLFLMTFKWGIAGAAAATLIAKIPCAVIAYIHLRNKENPFRISFRGFKFDKTKLKTIVKIGLPTAVGGSTMQFGFLLMSKNVLEYGDLAVAAYGIGNRINGIISMPSNAAGSAVATIVGQNLGAGNIKRAENAYKTARKMIVIFLFCGGMILSSSPVSTTIVRIFSSDKQVITWAAEFLSIMAFCCFTNGIHDTTKGLFQGSGHTLILMFIDAARLWVFRFATIYAGREWLGMDVECIWYSVVVSNAISALILWVLYKMRVWKRNSVKIA